MVYRIRFTVRPSASIHSQIIYAATWEEAVKKFKKVWSNAQIVDVAELPGESDP